MALIPIPSPHVFHSNDWCAKQTWAGRARPICSCGSNMKPFWQQNTFYLFTFTCFPAVLNICLFSALVLWQSEIDETAISPHKLSRSASQNLLWKYQHYSVLFGSDFSTRTSNGIIDLLLKPDLSLLILALSASGGAKACEAQYSFRSKKLGSLSVAPRW